MGAGLTDGGSSRRDRWLQTAVRYLARLDRTSTQVERFLQRKGATPLQARQTVNRLSALRYLNDRAFGERWIEARLARQPMGRERLKAELSNKGIDAPLVDKILRRALGTADQETWARRALVIRERRSRKLSCSQAFRLLHQWGFDEETIERIIEERRAAEGSDT